MKTGRPLENNQTGRTALIGERTADPRWLVPLRLSDHKTFPGLGILPVYLQFDDRQCWPIL